MVAFAVGVGECISFSTFAAVVSTTNHCIAWCNRVATVVVNCRWCRLGSSRDAGNRATAVGRHREIVALDGIGVDPIVMIALAIGVGECISLSTFTTVVGTALYCCTWCNCVITVVADCWWRRLGSLGNTSNRTATICWHIKILIFHRICECPCLCMTCTIGICIYIRRSTFATDCAQIRRCCQCTRRRNISSTSIGNRRHNTRA